MTIETKLPEHIKSLLIERALTLAVAESSSGGLLSEQFTRIPGSSVYFKGGIVTYSNDSKRDILLINPDLIRIHGAVSSEVVLEMAKEARRIFKTDIALAISGITGPTGGTEEKPVGLTYIGIDSLDQTSAERFVFKGDREEIRKKSVLHALKLLLTYLVNE